MLVRPNQRKQELKRVNKLRQIASFHLTNKKPVVSEGMLSFANSDPKDPENSAQRRRLIPETYDLDINIGEFTNLEDPVALNQDILSWNDDVALDM